MIVVDEQRLARWEAMIWSTVTAGLRDDADGLGRLVDEMDIDTARNAVYVLATAVADFYRRHARMTGNSPERILEEISFVAIECGFALDVPPGAVST